MCGTPSNRAPRSAAARSLRCPTTQLSAGVFEPPQRHFRPRTFTAACVASVAAAAWLALSACSKTQIGDSTYRRPEVHNEHLSMGQNRPDDRADHRGCLRLDHRTNWHLPVSSLCAALRGLIGRFFCRLMDAGEYRRNIACTLSSVGTSPRAAAVRGERRHYDLLLGELNFAGATTSSPQNVSMTLQHPDTRVSPEFSCANQLWGLIPKAASEASWRRTYMTRQHLMQHQANPDPFVYTMPVYSFTLRPFASTVSVIFRSAVKGLRHTVTHFLCSTIG